MGVVAPRGGCEQVAGVGANLGAFEAAHEVGLEVVGGRGDLGGWDCAFRPHFGRALRACGGPAFRFPRGNSKLKKINYLEH